MMSRSLLFCFLVLCRLGFSQSADTVSQEYVSGVLNFLASDSLKGRGNYTPELFRAASFIAKEFEKDSLRFFPGYNSYFDFFSHKRLTEMDIAKEASGYYDPTKFLANVISILPGKTHPGEAIIFSAHYDHVGIEADKKDSIFNGANDNASGTTALLALARYYAHANNNARTLIFCAFAGEELGLLGSEFFSKTINAKNIVAMVNIEMVGITGASGKNSFFITGEDHSDFRDIVKSNLKGYKFRVRNEPSLTKELFRRSDNFSFAKLGIPAHTIMCSDDDDPCYHKPCDEVKRINISNMTSVIKAIVIGVSSIVEGKSTPERINHYRF